MLRRLSLKKQFYIISSALFLGSALLGVFIIYPTIQKMLSVSNSIQDIQQELENQYTNTQAMRRTLRELDAVNEEIANYKAFAMPSGEELSIIEELESLAKEHTLTQTLGANFSSTPDTAVGLPYYTFSFVLTGSFDDIYNYIRTLESQSYYVLIQGIDLQRGGSPGQASLRFDARIYARQNT